MSTLEESKQAEEAETAADVLKKKGGCPNLHIVPASQEQSIGKGLWGPEREREFTVARIPFKCFLKTIQLLLKLHSESRLQLCA